MLPRRCVERHLLAVSGERRADVQEVPQIRLRRRSMLRREALRDPGTVRSLALHRHVHHATRNTRNII